MTYTLKDFVKPDGELKTGDDINTYDSFGKVCEGTVQFLEDEIVHIRLKGKPVSIKSDDYIGD